MRGHLLVLDADASARDALVEDLANRGWVVEAADTGARAIERVQATQVSAVLCNTNVPDFQEHQFARAIRGCVGRELLLVGFASHGELARARRSGYDEVVARPVDLDKLELIVARWLQHHAR